MSSRRDISTRTARSLRTSVVRWFGLLAIPWILAAVGVAWLASGWVGLAALPAGAAVVGGFVLLTTLGLRRILGRVDRLDEERHGLREAYDRARLDSLRDGLTGLGNHRAYQEELDEQIAIARADDLTVALMLLDVDDLKKTNDAKGHSAGDDLLRATARIIAGNLRRSDRGFRIGGDEFAILLVDCRPDEALAIGRRILAQGLGGGSAGNGEAPFSLTIGISAFPGLSRDRQQLQHQADAALYWGKRHGRTEVQLYDPSRHGMAEDWRPLHELAAAVARVARDRLLTPVYQPIYCLRTGQVLGYEGLVRPLTGAGFANAGALFVAAETTDRTVELDLVSAEAVIRGAEGLEESAYLSVNLSPRSLEADGFSPAELLALARQHGIDPTRIVVELTEREAVEDLDRLRKALAFLRRHGVRIAADDIGAGNAGLRLLSEVEFDIMKIDLLLVRAGARSDPSDAVLRALRELARRRGQVIVAEGVETAEQLEVIRELGFGAAQGYLLARPAPHHRAEVLDLDRLVGHPQAAPLGSLGGAAASP